MGRQLQIVILTHLGLVIHEAALLKLEAIQILFYLVSISSQFADIYAGN